MRTYLPWRVQSNDEGGFDELVVGGRGVGVDALIHAEMMSDRSIFVSIGPLCIWAHVTKSGRVKVTHTKTRPTPKRSKGGT